MVPTHSPLPQPPLVLANWTFHQTATSLLLHWTLVLCSEYIMYDVQCIADVCRSNDGIPLSSCGHWQVAHKWRVKVKARAPCLQSTTPTYCNPFWWPLAMFQSTITVTKPKSSNLCIFQWPGPEILKRMKRYFQTKKTWNIIAWQSKIRASQKFQKLLGKRRKGG